VAAGYGTPAASCTAEQLRPTERKMNTSSPSTLSDLERRLARLEDIEAIRRLKFEYCRVCDDAHNTDSIVELFTEDGIWESAGQVGLHRGVHRGREAIRAVFASFGQQISLSQHNVMNPAIDVADDGLTAEGVWYFLGMFEYPDGDPSLLFVRYEETYRKVDGRWLFQHLRAIASRKYELPADTIS
jgi:hypothetical protein